MVQNHWLKANYATKLHRSPTVLSLPIVNSTHRASQEFALLSFMLSIYQEQRRPTKAKVWDKAVYAEVSDVRMSLLS